MWMKMKFRIVSKQYNRHFEISMLEILKVHCTVELQWLEH